MGFFKRLVESRRTSPPAPTTRTELPSRAEKHFDEGKAHFTAGRWAQARAALERAVELAPASPNAQFLLGASRIQLGDLEGSIGPLTRCVELDPRHPDAHNSLGMALGRLDRFQEADRYIARAAFLGHPQARQTLARMNMDFCRQCGAPVSSSRNPGTDITFVSGDIGIACSSCSTVFCVRCLDEAGLAGIPDPACPKCKGRLRFLGQR